MAENKRWLDLLAIPLLVGLAIAVATYALPLIFGPKKEITYTASRPIRYPTEGLSISVNGAPATDLYAYSVTLRNSGNRALSNVPVSVVFKTNYVKTFQIFSVRHNTVPAVEFGKIADESPDAITRRVIYELLNPGDSDTITLFTNMTAEGVDIYARGEDLTIKATSSAMQSVNVNLLASIIAGLAAVLAVFQQVG